MVNSDGQITKPVTAVAETGKSKKKRPRVRVRSRNKAVRLAQQNTVDNSIDTKSLEQPNSQQVELDSVITKAPTRMSATTPTVPTAAAAEKSREQILAEREAKKLAKQAKKVKIVSNDGATQQQPATTTQAAAPSAPPAAAVSESAQAVPTPSQTAQPAAASTLAANAEKSREQIKAEREAKKLAKQAAKAGKSGATAAPASVENTTQQLAELKLAAGNAPAAATQAITQEKKKPELTKAERRAIQEAQRAAKAQAQAHKNPAAAATTAKSAAAPKATPAKVVATEASSAKAPATVASPVKSNASAAAKPKEPRVKLFNHLQSAQKDASLFINNAQIHPSITRLGEQYAQRTIVGSNARCIAFLNALKMVIHDFETPPKKEFARSLEATLKICVDHLQQCRPLAVSVCNAYKHINNVLTQLPADQPESDLKQNLCHFIETYIENQIGKAAQAISSMLQEKIIDGDVLLTFGCSSLIHFICEEAQKRKVDFRVIIVDSRPFFEGQELLRRLSAKGIPCTYVLINALGFVMPEATKVLLGAHALLSNGYVMARTGTAQVALVARSFNVPVLVCCETHKFSERFQTDAIVYNELGNPDDLCLQNQNNASSNALAKGRVAMLNLNYDITPPELVTAVVTEVSILPCTSVPVILRIKPTEIGYYC